MILDILSCIQKTQYLDICSISNVAIVKNDCTVAVVEKLMQKSI